MVLGLSTSQQVNIYLSSYCKAVDCFTLSSNMRPIMMMKLLSMLTVDLPALTENTVISLRMLTHHYERCTTYYSSGHPDHGIAGDEEKRLTMILFTRLFDALAQRVSHRYL